MPYKFLFPLLLSLVVVLLGVPKAPVQADECKDCLNKCEDKAAAEVASCEATCDALDLDPTDPSFDPTFDLTACYTDKCDPLNDTSACDTTCSSCTISPTTTTTTTTPTTPTSVTKPTFLKPPFGSTSQASITVIIAILIQILLGIVGSLALLMFVWGGMNLIFSHGNEEMVTKGKKILIWAVIGLAVVLASYALLSFTFSIFQTATGA
ncbi:MAG: pilin [Patescibacteria group bacterium]|jgi:hypothetical protein